MEKTYNGWTNWETWSIALHINDDLELYLSACAFVSYQRKYCSWTEPERHCLGVNLYDDFVKYAELEREVNPDLVAYRLPCLDRDSLSEMLRDLVS